MYDTHVVPRNRAGPIARGIGAWTPTTWTEGSDMHKVLFYKTTGGNDVVKNWIKDFSKEEQKIIGEDLLTVQLGFPLGLPLCRSLGNGLWEVRSTLTSKVEARMIFYFHSQAKALVVLHGFIKKTMKTPRAEIDLALRRKREFDP
jgi:phage-related protein